MKIRQNPENGQIYFELKNDEVYDIEEHLNALIEFTTEQAVIVFDLKRSYKKILEQLAELRELLSDEIS